MKLTCKEQLVLLGVLRDREAIAAQDWNAWDLPTARQRGARRIRIDEARDGLCPMNLCGWIGREPTGSDAVMYSRVYAALEERGLVERHRLGGTNRTSHLRLTPEGEVIARSLAEGNSEQGQRPQATSLEAGLEERKGE